MKTIKIRDLRGPVLEQHARAGQLVGITRDRALIAVLVPMLQAWVEHMIDHNWSQVLESTTAAEERVGAGEGDLTTLDGVLWRTSLEGGGSGHEDHTVEVTPENNSTSGHGDGDPQSPPGQAGYSAPNDIVSKLSKVLGLDVRNAVSTNNVRVGDLTARRIDQANSERELLTVTNDGLLVGILVPVSEQIVEFLVAQNLSRVIYNIHRGEHGLEKTDSVVLLDDVLETDPSGEPIAINSVPIRYGSRSTG